MEQPEFTVIQLSVLKNLDDINDLIFNTSKIMREDGWEPVGGINSNLSSNVYLLFEKPVGDTQLEKLHDNLQGERQQA